MAVQKSITEDVVCNISYHFNKHGARFGTIAAMTRAAQRYFMENRQPAKLEVGILKFPNDSKFETEGRIITFI
jgi:hypothetical protein